VNFAQALKMSCRDDSMPLIVLTNDLSKTSFSVLLFMASTLVPSSSNFDDN